MRKYLSILLIALIAVWAVSCGALEERRKAKKMAEEEAIDSNIVEEVVLEDNTEAEKDTLVSETVVVVTEEDEETTDENNQVKIEKKFYVIVGSFVKEENAKDLYKKLSKSGAPSQLLDGEGNFTRVSKKAFRTKEEAMKELERVRKVEKRADAWILTAENK